MKKGGKVYPEIKDMTLSLNSSNFYKNTCIFCELGDASNEGTYSLRIYKSMVVDTDDELDNINFGYDYLFDLKIHMKKTIFEAKEIITEEYNNHNTETIT